MVDKLTDNDVIEMLNGMQNPGFLRSGLCGKDVSNVDMSELSTDMFLRLSFDQKTVFSKEQIEKFNPSKILENGKKLDPKMQEIQDGGYTAKGVNVAIIDSNICNNLPYVTKNVSFKNKENSGIEETHGQTVLSAFLQIAPDANVTYYCDNKRDKNRDYNILKYVEDIAKNKDIKIISMSSRIQNADIQKEVDKILNKNGITLIDSRTFSNDFTYCYKKADDKNCEYLEDFVLSDKYDVKYNLKNGIDKMKEYFGINGNTQKDFDSLINILSNSGNYKSEIEILTKNKDIFMLSDEKEFSNYIKSIRTDEINKEKQERSMKQERNNTLIEVPCGGKTFFGEDGYKYFSTSSVSYTLPQISAMFAIARSIDKDISYNEFVNIARNTSRNIDDRLIISPSTLLRQIQFEKTKSNDIYLSGIEATKDTRFSDIFEEEKKIKDELSKDEIIKDEIIKK